MRSTEYLRMTENKKQVALWCRSSNISLRAAPLFSTGAFASSLSETTTPQGLRYFIVIGDGSKDLSHPPLRGPKNSVIFAP